MRKLLKYFSFFIMLLIFTGCSHKVSYTPDNMLSNKLNQYKLNSINVEKTYNTDLLNSYELSLGGDKLISYYGNSFEDYLVEALKIQLHQNNLFNKKSNIDINTTLLLNELKIGNFEASFRIIANFQINDNNKTIYNVTKSINHEFKIPLFSNALKGYTDNYSIAIQKVISSFFNDNFAVESLKMDNK